MTRARVVVVAGCAYEIVAVLTGRVPTVTALCRRHWAAEALLLGWLLVHFHRKGGA